MYARKLEHRISVQLQHKKKENCTAMKTLWKLRITYDLILKGSTLILIKYLIRFHPILNYTIWQIKLVYCIVSYHIESSHIVSYHIISYHVISYHIISYHIISYHIISYCIILYHIISYHILPYNIMAYPISKQLPSLLDPILACILSTTQQSILQNILKNNLNDQ